MLIPIALLALAMGVAFNSGPKASPAPPKNLDDGLSGGTGDGSLEDDGTMPEPEPEDEPGLDLPSLEDEETPSWEQVAPCAADLKGFILVADEYAAMHKRSVIFLMACKRDTELEAQFHMACAEDESDSVDFVVLHMDDIDFSDPYNAGFKSIIEGGCGELDGAIGVIHYSPDGPRLLVYDGFEGAARLVLSYPNTTDLDPFDVVDLAYTLAIEGTVPGIDGSMVEGPEFEELLHLDG